MNQDLLLEPVPDMQSDVHSPGGLHPSGLESPPEVTSEFLSAPSQRAHRSPNGRSCTAGSSQRGHPANAREQRRLATPGDGASVETGFSLRVRSTGLPDQRALATIGRIILTALARMQEAERLGAIREEP